MALLLLNIVQISEALMFLIFVAALGRVVGHHLNIHGQVTLNVYLSVAILDRRGLFGRLHFAPIFFVIIATIVES